LILKRNSVKITIFQKQYHWIFGAYSYQNFAFVNVQVDDELYVEYWDYWNHDLLQQIFKIGTVCDSVW
jgi:hypothetical protein